MEIPAIEVKLVEFANSLFCILKDNRVPLTVEQHEMINRNYDELIEYYSTLKNASQIKELKQ